MEKKTKNNEFSSDGNFINNDEKAVHFSKHNFNDGEKNVIVITEEKKTEEKNNLFVPDWKLYNC